MYYINSLKQEPFSAKTYEHTLPDERYMYIVDRHLCHLTDKFSVFVDEFHINFPTLYLLLKLHNRPNNARLMANSSVHVLLLSCTFDFLPHCDLKPL